MNAQPSTGEHPKQEPSDLRPRVILLCAAGVITMVLLVALLAYGMTGALDPAKPPKPSTYLTSDPTIDSARYRQEKRSQLETYGWVDGQRFAHIPIEQAMHKLAASGNASAKKSK